MARVAAEGTRIKPGGDQFRTPRPGTPIGPQNYRGSVSDPGQTRERPAAAMEPAANSSSFARDPGFRGTPGVTASSLTQPQVPASGTDSGPGILESWFNQRATGSDPAFDYLSKRGMEGIGTSMAAGGSFNSGARGRQISDFLANLTSQRMGQLDTLAGGASGEHQRRLESMFGTGMGLAGGQANQVAPFATGAAGAMGDAATREIMLLLNKAGVDANTRAGILNFLQNAGKTAGSIATGKPVS